MYNSEKFIGRCLKSVLLQTFREIEVICIDDCSCDNTVNIVTNFIKNDNRVILIRNVKNSGPSVSRNEGLIKSNGDYVMFVDSDDYIEPGTINYLVNYVKKNKYPDFVRYNFFSKNNRYNNKLGILTNKIFTMPESRKTIIDSFFSDKEKVPTFVHLLFIKKKVADDMRFDERMCYLEDSSFYLDLFSIASRCAFIDKKFYNYVENKDSITRNINNTSMKVFDMFKLCDKITKYKLIDESDKKKIISRIINLMMSHLMILEKSSWKMFLCIIKQKQFRKMLKNIDLYSGLIDICFVKKLYVKILQSSLYVFSIFFMPIVGIKYHETYTLKGKK